MRRKTIADATFYDLFCAKVATFSALLSRLPGYCFANGKNAISASPSGTKSVNTFPLVLMILQKERFIDSQWRNYYISHNN